MPKLVLKIDIPQEISSEDYLKEKEMEAKILKDENKKVLESLFIRNEEGEISEMIAVDADGNYYTSKRNQERFAILQNVLDACLTSVKLSLFLAFLPELNPALTNCFLSDMTRNVNQRNWEFSQFKEVF